ncbi:MAG: hypothetical protein LBS64_00665 [Spirochaetaceae bacterium]|jgi:hypothetical protein|nr:hypothetical protein [Spirochaetaceae bacterium]
MAQSDWLPRREQGLVDLLVKWVLWLVDTAKRTLFGWDETECEQAADKIKDFTNARETYEADKSPENRLAKDEAKAAALAAMRGFANTSVRFNPKMTDTDRLVLGIHPKDNSHTPKPKPTDHVDFTLSVDAQGHVVRSDFHISGSASRSKGPYHGAEARIWVLPLSESPPPGPHHPGWRSEVDTATPWEHQFDDDEIGKRLYITMRWENPSVGKGEDPESSKGPWSVIQSVVIA